MRGFTTRLTRIAAWILVMTQPVVIYKIFGPNDLYAQPSQVEVLALVMAFTPILCILLITFDWWVTVTTWSDAGLLEHLAKVPLWFWLISPYVVIAAAIGSVSWAISWICYIVISPFVNLCYRLFKGERLLD